MEKRDDVPLNAVYALDDNYLVQCGVSVVSLLENEAGNGEINLYFLNNGLSDDSIGGLRSLCAGYGAKAEFLDVKKHVDSLIGSGVKSWGGGATLRMPDYSSEKFFPRTSAGYSILTAIR